MEAILHLTDEKVSYALKKKKKKKQPIPGSTIPIYVQGGLTNVDSGCETVIKQPKRGGENKGLNTKHRKSLALANLSGAIRKQHQKQTGNVVVNWTLTQPEDL